MNMNHKDREELLFDALVDESKAFVELWGYYRKLRKEVLQLRMRVIDDHGCPGCCLDDLPEIPACDLIDIYECLGID